KVLWETSTGRILGGQASGIDGVDKRLDVLATAIKGNLTVDDLEHLELSYALPFGSAKDPLNIAGFSANVIRSGHCAATVELAKDGMVQQVDVRSSEMARRRPIPCSVNIPYAQTRSRMIELDKSHPAVTVCGLGKTSD